MVTEKLHDLLITLANRVLEKAFAFQNSGRQTKVSYQRVPAKNINYEDNCFQYDFERTENFDVWKWQSGDFGEFIRNEVLTLPEYQCAIDEYTSTYGYPPDGARVALDTFYRYFIERATEGSCTCEAIERYVDVFIKECGTDFKKLRLTIDLWLGNIYIDSDELELASDVFLRRATAEQLAHTVEYPHYFEEIERFAAHVVPSTVLLSFSLETEWSIAFSLNDAAVVSEIEQWLNVLRLFRPSTLYTVRQVSTQRSVFGYQMTEAKELPGEKFLEGKVAYKDKTVHKFVLKKDDEHNLVTFVSRVKPALSETSPMAYLSGSPLDLALHRYTDALIKSEITAYKILSSITSLEALLSDGKTEITYRISLRIASIMYHLGFNTKDVFEKMKKAYDLRSKLVHGSSLDKGKLLEFASQHCYEIINYNRVCLLSFMLLQKQIRKSELLTMIDCSLIDEQVKAELAMLMKVVSETA